MKEEIVFNSIITGHKQGERDSHGARKLFSEPRLVKLWALNIDHFDVAKDSWGLPFIIAGFRIVGYK